MLIFDPWCQYWVIFLVFAGSVEQAHQSRVAEAAEGVQEGMSRDEVLEIMGPPDVDYRPGWNHWLYGSGWDLDAMFESDGSFNPIPIRLRIFSYDEDDVVIRWSDNDRVEVIDRPQSLEAPERYHQILDTCIFVQTVFWTISRSDAG